MMANVFKKLGGARAGTINKIYEPMGYHEDDPHIELEGKTFDQVIQEIHEQGFTGRSSLVSLTKKQKVYAKVKRIPCGNTACSKMSKITWYIDSSYIKEGQTAVQLEFYESHRVDCNHGAKGEIAKL